MESDFGDFDDIDEDLLRSLPLDFPFEDEDLSDAPPDADTDADSGISSVESILAESEVPSEFPFPFTPYDIQVDFMKNVYKALDQSKIAIMESPTGTGKSMSLICGTLTWLRDFEEKQKKDLELLLQGSNIVPEKSPEKEPTKQKSGELDWVTAFAQEQEVKEKAKKLKEEHEQRLKREARLEEIRKNMGPTFKVKRKRAELEEKFDELFKDTPKDLHEKMKAELENKETDGDDDHVVLDEYNSDDEKYWDDGDSADEDDADDDTHVTKIYYCSRTHSQLSQLVREVQKSPFGEDTRVVSLGSRQNLCVNEAVRKLKSLSLINDRCLELQKNKSETKNKKDGEDNASKKRKLRGGCPFYKQEPLTEFRDRALVDVKDIEQLVSLGRSTKACPYYGTRFAIPAAQLVALPYQTLLHRATRGASGIKLKGNIVVIDEAHNLVETISNIHSVEVTGTQVTCAYSQLTQYMDRFRSRLKAKNLMYIKQILFILSSFIKTLGGKPGLPADQQSTAGKHETKLRTINDFLFDSQLDNLNLYKILRYCQRSLISKKLHGFVEKYQPPSIIPTTEKREERPPTWALSKFLKEISRSKENVGKKSPEKGKAVETLDDFAQSMSSPLMHIEGFLEALTNTNKDGRIVINRQELLSKSSLKFLLLNPAVHFGDVLSEARAVILAGGTMQPVSEFKDQLLFAAGADQARLLEFSCGHVIPRDNLLAIALARGSSGQELDFTYKARERKDMMDELGRVVYNVCNIVPGGVVVFFPSYEYERAVHAHWEANGFLGRIGAKKRLFREPKRANQVDSVLHEYTSCIKKHMSNKYSALTGALLMCVVGGKMSEGINFSDELGRCIIMVGLPYPNIRSPELKEKMDYLNTNMPKAPDGKLPGQVHYENLCMKAVNQSIGRAIRHKGDYACILLLDHRYLRPGMRTRLPSWIGSGLQPVSHFGPGFASIRNFFSSKKPEKGSPVKHGTFAR